MSNNPSLSVLACPACLGSLRSESAAAVCDTCHTSYPNEATGRLDLRLPGAVGSAEAMLFNAQAGEGAPQRFRAVYQLDVNEWNGRERVQLIVRHLQAE